MRIVTISYVSMVLLAAAVNAQTTQPVDLTKLLKQDVDWKTVRVLEAWDRPLTQPEIERLRQLVQSGPEAGWMVTTAAERLLRRFDPNAKAVPKVIDQAEKILLKVKAGKVTEDASDPLADDLARLGPAVLPLLAPLARADGPRGKLSPQRVSILALSQIPGEAALTALWDAFETTKQQSRPLLVAELLKRDASKASVDRIIQRLVRIHGFDEELAIRAVQSRGVPPEARLAFYGRYDAFDLSSKHAIVRGLADLDTPEAFAQLSNIVIAHDSTFATAVTEIAHMGAGDPEPVLTKALSLAERDELVSVIDAVNRRSCRAAIPVLRELQSSGKDAANASVIAAALAAFGEDVNANVKIVRTALEKAAPQSIQAASMVNDTEVIRLLCTMAEEKSPRSRAAIMALKRIGSPLALPTLRRLVVETPPPEPARRMTGFTEMPPVTCGDLAAAMHGIADRTGDEQLHREALAVERLPEALAGEIAQSALSRAQRRAVREHEFALNFIRAHPDLMLNFLKALPDDACLDGFASPLLFTLDATWRDAYIAPLEHILQTNTDTMTWREEGKPVKETYRSREGIAALLTRKTGKPYTYVDVDGTVQSPAPRSSGVPQ